MSYEQIRVNTQSSIRIRCGAGTVYADPFHMKISPHDADIVLMSGSGPTMAAYYEDREKASLDFIRMKELASEHSRWRTWLTATGLD